MSNLEDSLSPGFLIASPKLDDSVFERALVMMVHHDEEGAMGFVINKPLEVDFGSLLETAAENAPSQISPSCHEVPVRFGGPVRVEQLWLIFQALDQEHHPTFDEESGALHFDELWYLVASSDKIELFASGHNSSPYIPLVGYTGWGPGQLESEIEDGSWLYLDFHEELAFPDDFEAAWGRALTLLGVDPMAFLMMSKVGRA